MNIEEKTKVTIDSITDDGCFSVLTQTYILYNGQEHIINNHRRAFVPTKAEKEIAKEILPNDLYKVINILWTTEKMNAWSNKQEEFMSSLGE